MRLKQADVAAQQAVEAAARDTGDPSKARALRGKLAAVGAGSAVALRQLSPEQREVLLLRMAAGLTAPEVAAIVGKTTGAVRALQRRGVAGLARVLGVTNHTSAPEPLAGSSGPARLTSRVEGVEGG